MFSDELGLVTPSGDWSRLEVSAALRAYAGKEVAVTAGASALGLPTSGDWSRLEDSHQRIEIVCWLDGAVTACADGLRVEGGSIREALDQLQARITAPAAPEQRIGHVMSEPFDPSAANGILTSEDTAFAESELDRVEQEFFSRHARRGRAIPGSGDPVYTMDEAALLSVDAVRLELSPEARRILSQLQDEVRLYRGAEAQSERIAASPAAPAPESDDAGKERSGASVSE